MSLAAPGTNPASNLELKLPHTIGSANQLLKVDGNGQLGWADDNSGVSLSGSTNNTIATVTGANALQGESGLTFGGSTLRIEADSPQLQITESDTSTSSRLVMAGGRLYIQIAQQGQGSSTSPGIMYLTGYNNTDASEIHFKANNTYNTGHLHLEDGKVLKMGNGDDFQVEHDGNDTYLGNVTGQLVFQNDANIKFTAKTGGTERFGIYSNRVDTPHTLRLSGGWSDIGTQMCLGADANGSTYIAGYNLRINTGSNNSRTTAVYVAPNGLLGLGLSSPTNAYGIDKTLHIHSALSSGNRGAGIHLTTNSSGTASGAGARIAQVDNDLMIYNHEDSGIYLGTVGSEKVQISSTGGIQLKHYGCNRGIIWIHDGEGGSACSGMANVQQSGGRGIVSNKIFNIAANTTTDLAKSHWGGLVLVGWAGTGHQGFEQVAFGYGGTPSSQHKRTWVGSLSVTYTMSAYTLRISHNASNALDFWCILIGV